MRFWVNVLILTKINGPLRRGANFLCAPVGGVDLSPICFEQKSCGNLLAYNDSLV